MNFAHCEMVVVPWSLKPKCTSGSLGGLIKWLSLHSSMIHNIQRVEMTQMFIS